MGSQEKDRLKVTPIIRLPNFRVLTWDEDFLYISREYTLFRINGRRIGGNELKLEKVGSFKPDAVRRVACKNKILGRLLRTGFHAVRVLSNSKIVGTVAKNIVVLEPGGERFISTWRIKRGTRPIGLAVTHDGRIYWGEYFANPERDEVYVYGSEDGGYTWEVVYAFPKKSIRHIHNIFYDPYGNSFWILTGDEEKEPRIIRASPDWRWMDVILQGNQQARAVTMILKKDEIFYATDTTDEQNYIYRLERKTGKVERVFPIPGPGIWSTEVGDIMFFSSASEPGRVHCPYACLFGSWDGDNWMEVVKWKKDRFHPRLFQYGRIILPFGYSKFEFLAATGRAVIDEDEWLTIWKVERVDEG